jgi:hypothetical protein
MQLNMLHKIQISQRQTLTQNIEMDKVIFEAQNLPGCTAMFLIECRPTFQGYVLPPLSGRWDHHPDDGGSIYLWNVGRHSIKKTAVQPRRLGFILAAVRTWNLTKLYLMFFFNSQSKKRKKEIKTGQTCRKNQINKKSPKMLNGKVKIKRPVR